MFSHNASCLSHGICADKESHFLAKKLLSQLMFKDMVTYVHIFCVYIVLMRIPDSVSHQIQYHVPFVSVYFSSDPGVPGVRSMGPVVSE